MQVTINKGNSVEISLPSGHIISVRARDDNEEIVVCTPDSKYLSIWNHGTDLNDQRPIIFARRLTKFCARVSGDLNLTDEALIRFYNLEM
jgi:hypothetical protein